MEDIQLTDKQKLFIVEYLKNGFNATQAAISAGYSEDAAKQIGTDNLAKTYIRQAIDKEIQLSLNNKREELKQRIITEYMKLAFSDVKDLADYDQDGVKVKPSNEVDTSVLSSVEIDQEIVSSKTKSDVLTSNKKIKFKLHDKVKALESLGRYLSMFNDKVDLNIPEGIEITVNRIKANENQR